MLLCYPAKLARLWQGVMDLNHRTFDLHSNALPTEILSSTPFIILGKYLNMLDVLLQCPMALSPIGDV